MKFPLRFWGPGMSLVTVAFTTSFFGFSESAFSDPPGAVEFAEVDALPAAQDQLAALDDYRGAVADEGGFEVAVGVALIVLVVGFGFGDELVELL